MSGDGKNFIACAFGMKRSGKSYALGKLAQLFPRRILVDFTGEYVGKVDGAHYATSIGETVDELQKCRKAGTRWAIVSTMRPEDAIELCGVLAPVGKKPESSFSYACGGVVVECGEIQLIAPNYTLEQPVQNIIAMGRHFRVSILGAARRPREVSRFLTSQSDAILAFRQHEPRDTKYLGEVMRSDVPDYLRQLRPFSHVLFKPNFGTLELVDAKGKSSLIPAPED